MKGLNFNEFEPCRHFKSPEKYLIFTFNNDFRIILQGCFQCLNDWHGKIKLSLMSEEDRTSFIRQNANSPEKASMAKELFIDNMKKMKINESCSIVTKERGNMIFKLVEVFPMEVKFKSNEDDQ